jgi:hypothetical protein
MTLRAHCQRGWLQRISRRDPCSSDSQLSHRKLKLLVKKALFFYCTTVVVFTVQRVSRHLSDVHLRTRHEELLHVALQRGEQRSQLAYLP